MKTFLCILAVGFSVIWRPIASAAEGTAVLASQLDAFLTQAYPATAPGAAVIVVNEGQILLRKGYGMANLELGVAMDADAVFRLGSITKQFTAVAILQLVEAGKIKLDDEVTTYVPELQVDGHPITLRHLLTHTSGLPNFTSFRRNEAEDITLTQIVELVKKHPAKFSPGDDWAYSNTGYWLLGTVIEKVSGQSYGDYIQAHLFKPAQMEQSSYDYAERIIPHRVPGYTKGSGKGWANAHPISMVTPFSAGALLSSVGDLWKWEQALAKGTLVGPALLSIAYTPARLNDGSSTGYGFGWGIGTLARHPTVEHNGGIAGFHTNEIRIADEGIYIAVLCNSDTPPAQPEEIARHLASLLLGKATPIFPVTVPLDQLQKLTGVFRLNHSGKVEFDVKEGQLFVSDPRGYRFPLAALSPTEFIAPDNNADHYTFVPQLAGETMRLIWHSPSGPEVYGKRVNEPVRDPKNPIVSVPPEVLARYAGTYKIEGDIVTLKQVGDRLTVQSSEEDVIDLVAESNVCFHVVDLPVVFEFRFDLDGRVTGYTVSADNKEYSATKIE